MDSLDLKSEKSILNKLACDAADEKLLLFIGTGFSKAVVHSSGWSIDPAVPSWTDLLYELAQRMGLKPDEYVLPANSKYGESRAGEDPCVWKDLPNIDYACPTIATRMCKDWESLPRNAGKNGDSFMKELIASLSVWVPMKDMREKLWKVLTDINPIGIVTTNYDMVLEAILADNGQYLAREELFRGRNDERIPIWHVHGSIQDSKSIVVTTGDYQRFFRPDDYVQRKISMLLHEYTTLFVGYSMSDPNIATAVDWARHVFKHEVQQENDVVQIRLVYGQDKGVVRQDVTTKSMYYINTMDAIAFLEKLQANVSIEMDKRRKEDEKLSKLGKILLTLSEQQNVVQAQDGSEFENIIEKITKAAFRKNNPRFILKLIPYIQGCLANARARSRIDDNFEAYADWLFILLVILRKLPIDKMPPSLFALLGEELNAVLSNTGYERGQSFLANDLWLRESNTIPTEVLKAFLEYAERLQLRSLSEKLKPVLNPPKRH